MSSIFGGDTGITYEQLQQRQKLAENLRQQNAQQSPRNVGEGIHAIARALVARGASKQADKREGELDAQWREQVAGMGLDPIREGIFSRMPYGQRDMALLQWQNQQDALRRGSGGGGGGSSADAERARTQAIMQALLKSEAPPPAQPQQFSFGQIDAPQQAPSVQFGGNDYSMGMPAADVAPAPSVALNMPSLDATQPSFGAPEPSGMPDRARLQEAVVQALMMGETDVAKQLNSVLDAIPEPEQPDLTGTQREYEMAVQQGFQGSFLDYKTALAEAGRAQTNVTTNVGGESGPLMGTIPQGYTAIEDPTAESGYRMVAIPGGPADTSENAAAAQASRERSGNVVTEDIGRALGIVENDPAWTTGLGASLARIPGTQAKSLSGLIQTIKANVGFDRLQQMRDASPTGGALGAINKTEMDLLQSVLGNLDQSLSAEDLTRNLKRVNDIYLDIIHGPGARPTAAVPAGGVPDGVPPEVWDVMTDEERALWQN